MAFRNVLRNRRRTIITAAMIGIAVAVMVFFWAYAVGVHAQMIAFSTDMLSGQIEVHAAGFQKKPDVEKTVPDPERVRAALDAQPKVVAYTERVKFFGLASGPEGSSGAMIYGIDSRKERKVTFFQNRLVKGELLEPGDDGILLAAGVVENLDLRLGEKVVLMSQAADGTIAAEAFRLKGVLRMGMPELDNSFGVIDLERAKSLMAVDEPHEIAIKVDKLSDVELVQAALRQSLGEGYEVLGWQDLLPQIEKAIELDNAGLYIYLIIVLIVAASGITNTVLMSVMERTREFGVMMAMGMRGWRVALMVLIEALVITLLGLAAGVLLGTVVSLIFEQTGIDFSAWADVFEYYGIPAVMYPDFNLETLTRLYESVLIVILASLLAATWPAVRAARLSPAKAMRHL